MPPALRKDAACGPLVGGYKPGISLQRLNSLAEVTWIPITAVTMKRLPSTSNNSDALESELPVLATLSLEARTSNTTVSYHQSDAYPASFPD
jgi:hypothetical protein